MILCIETATPVCSVAISDKGREIANKTLAEGQRHSSELAVIIAGCLSEARIKQSDLTAIAISDGPGSYTGLRVGASTAKGLCYGLEIPLIAIPTLQCISAQYRSKDVVVMPSIDARRMEAYTAIYRRGQELRPIRSTIWTEEVLNELVQSYGPITICGDGIAKIEGQVNPPEEIIISPNTANASLMCGLAHDFYEVGTFVDIAYHSPLYYKSPNITTPKRSLKG